MVMLIESYTESPFLPSYPVVILIYPYSLVCPFFCYSVVRFKFLDKDKISGVIIHEYIRGSSVHYGLAFLMRGVDTCDTAVGDHDSHIPQQPRLSMSFGHVYPGLDNLVKVYRACAEMVHSSSTAGANITSPANREPFHGASPFGANYLPISISGIRNHPHHPSPLWEY